jgi:hypothetical protein
MDEAEITERLNGAAQNLFANQPDIFEFTSATGQTEWNLVSHLANEIRKYFPDLDCDLDLLKPKLGNRRPDIVLHDRNSHKMNFLVIEVKRDRTQPDIDREVEKIETYWFNSELCYQFGAVVNLKRDKTFSVQVLQNSRYQTLQKPS